ncbi:MAG: hypothetical protein ACOYON_00400 [Fimbriimonas sp.]
MRASQWRLFQLRGGARGCAHSATNQGGGARDPETIGELATHVTEATTLTELGKTIALGASKENFVGGVVGSPLWISDGHRQVPFVIVQTLV